MNKKTMIYAAVGIVAVIAIAAAAWMLMQSDDTRCGYRRFKG